MVLVMLQNQTTIPSSDEIRRETRYNLLISLNYVGPRSSNKPVSHMHFQWCYKFYKQNLSFLYDYNFLEIFSLSLIFQLVLLCICITILHQSKGHARVNRDLQNIFSRKFKHLGAKKNILLQIHAVKERPHSYGSVDKLISSICYFWAMRSIFLTST